MIRFYKNLLNTLIIAFVTLYPILPSYGSINTDIILHLIFVVQALGIIFIPLERKYYLNVMKNIKKDKIFLSLLLLNVLMYSSTLISIDRETTLRASIKFSMYIWIYYNIAYNLRGKNIFKILLSSFAGVAVLSSIFSIYQAYENLTLNKSIDAEHRISSFLENSNILGLYAVLALFIVVMLLLNSKKKYQKLIFLTSSILLILNIILSQSRNALLALVFGSIVLSLLYNKKLILPSSIILGTLLIIPISRARIIDILSTNQNISRIKIWKITNLIIKDHSLFGTGYDTYSSVYSNYVNTYQDLMIRNEYIAYHPHNVFLKFQSELGILGTIFFVLFIVLTLYNLYKNIKLIKSSKEKAIIIGTTVSFLCFIFMNLVDSYFNSPKAVITLCIILGISNFYSSKKVKEPFEKYFSNGSLFYITSKSDMLYIILPTTSSL